MAKIIVIQHVPYEILGTMNPLLKKLGIRIKYVNFARHPEIAPKIEGYDGLIVLGGPMGAYENDRFPHLNTEIDIIEKAIALEIPILGICLGAQLIAKALGAEVRKNNIKEIGWYDLTLTEPGSNNALLSPFRRKEKIFQWHGDTFALPDGAIHLAKSEHCCNQAFVYNQQVYGFQFHLEVDEPLIERWLTVPAHQQELKALAGTIDSLHIRQQTSIHINRTKELAQDVFLKFCNMIGHDQPPIFFPSR